MHDHRPTNPADVRIEVHALFEQLLAAWTANDAVAYGACFTKDCDYVSYDGTRAAGRSAMVSAHDRLFRGVLKGSSLVGELESVALVGDGVALAYGTGSVLMPWRRRLPQRRLSRQTLVAVRTEAGWRFRALHNGRVRPVSIPEPGSLPARASQWIARAATWLGAARGSREENEK
jgi:uncharacterized protein (TIGR02246 family)